MCCSDDPQGPAPPWILERLTAVRTPLSLDCAATPVNIASVRRSFAAWLAADVAAGDLMDDLVLGVYEALANVVDHAYTGTPTGIGAVQLTAHRARTALRVTVADHGRWRTTGDAPHRSRGLAMIRLLVPKSHIETGLAGTVMHLHSDLPPPRPA
jgi:serine/threonine-protein kinase RsbW